jgi:hypothetical protein
MAYLLTIDLDYSPVYFKFEPEWLQGDPDNVQDQTWVLIQSGRRVPPDRVPKSAAPNVPLEELADVYRLNGQAWGVSRKFKAIVESLAPSDVEFIPIDIALRPGYTETFYFINVLRWIDAIIWEKSDFLIKGKSRRNITIKLPEGQLEGKPRIMLSRDKIGNAHIWHDFEGKFQFSDWVFASDALANKLRSSGITGLNLDFVEER